MLNEQTMNNCIFMLVHGALTNVISKCWN